MEAVWNAICPPGRVGVKICGVTNPLDAQAAIDAGADAIGINLFSGSKRFVKLGVVREWVEEITVARVAVVVNPDADLLARIEDAACFDAIQFHGDETPEFCAASPLPWVRAVRVSGADALQDALEYDTPALLLDADSPGVYGGSGASVDRSLAADFVRAHPELRIVLAGGLTPGSVADAVRAVRPSAVDVASGVEVDGEPRHKDVAKMRAFIDAVREA